jgi:hypothetical protein
MAERLALNPFTGQYETKSQYLASFAQRETTLRRGNVETHHAFSSFNPSQAGKLHGHIRAANAANDRGDSAAVRHHLTAAQHYLDGLTAPEPDDDEDDQDQDTGDDLSTRTGLARVQAGVHAPPRGNGRGGFDGDGSNGSYEQHTRADAERALEHDLARVRRQTLSRRLQALEASLYVE